MDTRYREAMQFAILYENIKHDPALRTRYDALRLPPVPTPPLVPHMGGIPVAAAFGRAQFQDRKKARNVA